MMRKTKEIIRRLAGRDEDGQGLAEYALILALIALVCVAALGALGTSIANSVGFKLFT
jgi:pilus assembly protein Flp/PilA